MTSWCKPDDVCIFEIDKLFCDWVEWEFCICPNTKAMNDVTECKAACGMYTKFEALPKQYRDKKMAI